MPRKKIKKNKAEIKAIKSPIIKEEKMSDTYKAAYDLTLAKLTQGEQSRILAAKTSYDGRDWLVERFCKDVIALAETPVSGSQNVIQKKS